MKLLRLVALVALTGPSRNAAASALGPTSRGTISISITIAPHFKPEAIISSGSRRGGILCVASNSMATGYELAIADLPTQKPGVDYAWRDWSPSVVHEPAVGCGPKDATNYFGALLSAEDLDKARQRPLTLLIIPE